MRKIVGLMALVAAVALMLAACGDVKTGNRVVSGSDVQTFTYAYVVLGGEKLAEGYITQWRDYSNSDVVQVLLNDGKYYLTHYTNVVMVADPRQGGLNYSNSATWGVEE